MTIRVRGYSALRVKDLVSPLTIRRIRVLQFGVIVLVAGFTGYYVWDNYLSAPSGEELVQEMVMAAGGMEAWSNVTSGQFTAYPNGVQ